MSVSPSSGSIVVRDATFLAGADDLKGLPPSDAPEIAFVGRSNVGKSSLLGALVGRPSLVRTSKKPGCTRHINLFEVDLAERSPVIFADLPGYGYAARSKSERDRWSRAIETYLLERPNLVGIVLLVDTRRGALELDRELAGYVASLDREPRLRLWIVATKIDKLAKAARKPAVEQLARGLGERVYPVSATSREGIDALLARLARLALPNDAAARADEAQAAGS